MTGYIIAAATALSLLLAASARPISPDTARKLMRDREEKMERLSDATRSVRRTLNSSSPDLQVIRSSAATIRLLAPKLASWFPPGTGPDSGITAARAEIWKSPNDFTAKSRAFDQAARALDSAAQRGELPAIRSRLAELSNTCKACHDRYRDEF